MIMLACIDGGACVALGALALGALGLLSRSQPEAPAECEPTDHITENRA